MFNSAKDTPKVETLYADDAFFSSLKIIIQTEKMVLGVNGKYDVVKFEKESNITTSF